MVALGAKNLENFLGDKLAVIVRIINDDLDRLFAPMTGETEVKCAGGSFHNLAGAILLNGEAG